MYPLLQTHRPFEHIPVIKAPEQLNPQPLQLFPSVRELKHLFPHSKLNPGSHLQDELEQKVFVEHELSHEPQ